MKDKILNNKKCDIIVPIYNSPEWVKLCIYSLIKNTPKECINKIILMNDNSDSLTCNCIKNLELWVVFIPLVSFLFSSLVILLLKF